MNYNLNRFILAQDSNDTYKRVIQELSNGKKESHWMWYIFPQLKGLGRSSVAQTYAISSLDEAKNYLEHPVLGSRLVECCRILLELKNRSAHEIFGTTDTMKLRSSMTLFALTSENPIFRQVILFYFDGNEDVLTKKIIHGTDLCS